MATRLRIITALCALCLAWPGFGAAGIFGVPTNLNANGTTSASSVNPPGFFLLTGTGSSNDDGDAVHQIRLFIEVTQGTVDVLVFDAGNNGARDLERDGSTATTYALLDPSGGTIASITINNDSTTTGNRLARFTPSGVFYAPNSANANNVSFSGLDNGLYEFRITQGGGTDVNAFGVDIRVAKGDTTHYNVFTVGDSTNPDTAMVIGALNSGTTPYANITQRAVFFPYVTRGCTLETSNFDMDTGAGNPGAGSAGEITDVLGTVTSLTMSGATVHSENSITIHSTAGTNLTCNNYGMYALTNNTGTQQNLTEWRVADFQGWNDNPANLPRDPANPVRMYLPNGYTPPIPPLSSATAPAAPSMTAAALVVSGANPPAAGQTTRFDIEAKVVNPTANAITDVQITIGLPAGVTYVADTQEAGIDGAPASCTDGSGSGFRRCTFASLAAGSAASLYIQVDFNRPAGLQNLTGAPAAGAPPPDTTVWSSYTPAYSSTAYPRTEYLGPLCNLVVNVGAAGALATRATIRGVRVNPDSVEFATGMQRGTVAFNVYGSADRQGTGPRTLLTPDPIPSPVLNSLTPILYQAETGPVSWPYLLIEEIDAQGRRRLMGPFDAADPHLRAQFDRIEARSHSAGTLLRRGARLVAPWGYAQLSRRPSLALERLPRRGSVPRGIKVAVSGEGTVRVPLADLQAHGLPAELLRRPDRLILTSQGQHIDFDVLRAPDGLPEAIAFRAAPLTTTYSGRNVYIFTWNSGAAPALSVELSREAEPRRLGMVRAEENRTYVAHMPQGLDPWMWDRIDPGAGPCVFGCAFDLPNAELSQAATIPILLRFMALSAGQHRIQASVNGQILGNAAGSGAGPIWLQGSLPASALASRGNELRFDYRVDGEPSGDPELYLDYLDLGVPTVAAAAVVTADEIGAFDPWLPSLRGVEYLIVTNPLFKAQADAIAHLKRREGLRAVVVDVERAYDRFSAGIIEANAVRALIRLAAEQGRLRYVLLIGDDTFDYRGNLAGLLNEYGYPRAVSYIPSLYGWDGTFGRIPSENKYGDLNDDGAPDVAIGRLPVQTPEQAAILAEKIARQAAVLRAQRGRHLFAVDNQGDHDAPFRSEAESVQALLPPISQVRWADIGRDGAATARETLLGGLLQGAMVTHYFGHAGPEAWADEGLLTPEDLPQLERSYRETVLFTWACEAQWFQYLFGPSINEALLLVDGGGALASFGPAGITEPALQRELFSRVYRNFFAGRMTLGEAIRQAKVETLAANPAARAVVEGWNLLGDPALRIPE